MDRVIFSASVTPDVIDFRRDGTSLIVDLGNGEDQLTIVDGLSARQIETFEFADGTTWTIETVRDRLLAGTNGDDELLGFDDRDDTLEGPIWIRPAEGGLGNDAYRLDVGMGQDAVLDSGGIDRLSFGLGVTAPMLHFTNLDGDLLIRLRGTTDSVIVYGGASTASSDHHIETFEFVDGTIVPLSNVLRALIADSSTPGDDVINARLGVPVQIDAGPGNDLILGQADTTLQFSVGDGFDIFDTTDQSGSSRVQLLDIASTDIELRRVDLRGSDLLIAVSDSGDQLLLRGALDNANISSIAFADGITWTRSELISASLDAQSTERNDVITGSITTTSFAAWVVTMISKAALVTIRSISTVAMVGTGLAMNGASTHWNCAATVRKTRWSLKPVSDRSELQLRFDGAHDEILLPFGGLLGVDLVRFGDGTEWTLDDLQEMAVGAGTPFSDRILGNANANVLAGGPGNDWLQGEDGSDTYVFERNGGQDIISDNGRADDINQLLIRDYVPDDATVITHQDRVNDLTLSFRRRGRSRHHRRIGRKWLAHREYYVRRRYAVVRC